MTRTIYNTVKGRLFRKLICWVYFTLWYVSLLHSKLWVTTAPGNWHIETSKVEKLWKYPKHLSKNIEILSLAPFSKHFLKFKSAKKQVLLSQGYLYSFFMVGINPLPEHLILKYQSAVGRSPTNYQTMPSSNWIKQEKDKKSFFKVWRGDWQGGEAGVLFLSSLLRISTWIKHKSRSQRINSLLQSPTFEIFSICATHKRKFW